MSYEEYKELSESVFLYLKEEDEYYRRILVYLLCTLMQKDNDVSEVISLVSDYINDLIEDSETEKAIVDSIKANTVSFVDDYTPIFFEGSEKFTLYERMLKRINNSIKMRITNAYPVINQFVSLVSHNILSENNYQTVKRRRCMSNKEYEDYLSVLKK
ncbi:MAG: hypothetical protein OSJ65_06710 [Bacilli bacterium]|nr:hypothetical protein [Bacilli bacterium]